MQHFQVKKMMESFFSEDIGHGDLTADLVFREDHTCRAQLIAKENGYFSGAAVLKAGYEVLSEEVEVNCFLSDGEPLFEGDVIAEVTGPARMILTGERVILNLIQRMSGITTITRKSVAALNDPSIQICDTRKTTPGLRALEKFAVRAGGGSNHRFGLYDGIMIKDNHIAACGSIKNAVRMIKETAGHMVKIEVEIETEDQLYEAIEAGADVIMFDNCPPEKTARFAKLVPGGIILEASGGITIENLPAYSGTGVDYISLGYLTHSAKALDISLDVLIHTTKLEVK
ncbi:nicotinate-nucleotide pyrophosphorylase [Bacillus gobiensis]|uniref:nicotinate-nucleotide diphosphorylase (carboxylating) n=3 Tax=Bacillaceae TaxID=186817 RepID=A0ABS4D0J6_9BACI|nr:MULTISPECIES: carboxylating nicotinate-nucleotide diphosphorylase [Bacillus]ALC81838.1 nicotinate-nucleotide pyrophosphorylase [Bacillus gobiensis]MBP1083147.1 nicotinate-nucleotide pyrophosphorylase (carboxylating) [Bacillus capparidis]MED1097588.1 carboxylating nicotinate-nucleotide diphosphorylase [Bacillus capparidis]